MLIFSPFLIILSIVESKLDCCTEYWPYGEDVPGVMCDYTSPSCHMSPFSNHYIVEPGLCCLSEGTSDIKEDNFTACVKSYGYKTQDMSTIFFQFQFLAKLIGGKYAARELWMMVAQMSKESMGFTQTREIGCFDKTPIPDKCKYGQCAGYPPGYYYGRGYIHLTHCYNYRNASMDLYGDDRLARDPDLVARDPAVAMETAVWFWAKNVHNRAGVQDGDFGATTKAVMGSGACKGQALEAKNRYKLFMKCLDKANMPDIKKEISEQGCYSRTFTTWLDRLNRLIAYTSVIQFILLT